MDCWPLVKLLQEASEPSVLKATSGRAVVSAHESQGDYDTLSVAWASCTQLGRHAAYRVKIKRWLSQKLDEHELVRPQAKSAGKAPRSEGKRCDPQVGAGSGSRPAI